MHHGLDINKIINHTEIDCIDMIAFKDISPTEIILNLKSGKKLILKAKEKDFIEMSTFASNHSIKDNNREHLKWLNWIEKIFITSYSAQTKWLFLLPLKLS